MTSNTLTLSQAHKIYTGDSMGLYALKLSIGGILMYSATILTFFIIMLLSKGNVSAALNEMSGSTLTNTFLTIDAGIILMITGLIQYDRHLPGGKYFRTVNGGFDTYRKMKNASLIARVISLISIMLFGALFDRLGILKLAFGTSGVIYIGAFLLLNIGLVNLIDLIKNPAVKGLSTSIVLVAGLAGVISPDITDGNIYFALAVAVTAVPFIIISQKIMLNNYKKNKWYK
ncbi:hypothetical protein [Ruminococcus albus]|uniref:Uncharacterized protein n=1 Tax=Ruminococcus albus TaxID=1264 RepID=A0A1I1R0R1_RUMAL|nr:hypothetical protein [Ruminococcus albus]SFD25123.1 hypothetical protein SAMN02910406_03502 [Ruminococcus albus]